MKISSKQYAIALFESTRHLSEEKVGEMVKNFVAVLKKNNDLSLGNKVIEEYQNYSRRQKGIAKIQITTGKKIDSDIINVLTQKLEQSIEIEQKVDTSIIGGAVIRTGDVLIDGSVRKRLEELRNRIG